MISIPDGFKFRLYELVDRHTFLTRGDAAWGVFSQQSIDMLHGVRTFLGVPIIINNWHEGGPWEWCGYRSPGCTIGAPQSEHRNGNAFDCHCVGLSAEDARGRILADRDNPLLKEVRRMEAAGSWMHIDRGKLKVGQERIYVFHA